MRVFVLPFVVIALVVVDAQQDGDLRLADGATESEGFVEVYHDGVWGTVCDDIYTSTLTDNIQNTHEVMCLQLGYATPGSEFRFNTGNTRTTTLTIWLDDLVCQGTETRVADCSHLAWGSHNCGHHEDVYISCTDPLPNYIFVNDQSVSWIEAEAYCDTTYGTHLASWSTLAQAEELQTLVGNVNVWIGLNDRTTNQFWEFSDGSVDCAAINPVTGCSYSDANFNYWNGGEPNDDSGTNNDCAHTYGSNALADWLNDGTCTYVGFPFVCNAAHRNGGTTPVVPAPVQQREPELQCHSAAAYAAAGNVGGYYSFTGQACHVSGDPHFQNMFNGFAHQFQGHNGQYIYMKSREDAAQGAMPFQLLSKHYQWSAGSVNTIDYVSLLLLDGANYDERHIVHIHSSDFFCVYALASSTQTGVRPQRDYDLNSAICTDIAASTPTPIGTSDRFVVEYTVNGGRRDVTLTVDGVCTLEFYFGYAGCSASRDGFSRNRCHTLHVYQSECFRCFTSGLCGEFRDNGQQISTCNDGLVTVVNDYGSFAYDYFGNTFDVEYCDPENDGLGRRRLIGDQPGELYVSDTGGITPVDACSEDYRQIAIDACAAVRRDVQNDACCLQLGDGGETCDEWAAACAFDGCAAASLNDEETEIDAFVATFATTLATQCAENDPAEPMFDPVLLEVDVEAEAAIVAVEGDPFEGLCLAGVATFDWDELTKTGAGKPEVRAFDMSVDETDLSLNIQVALSYEGRASADANGAVYGVTYVLDFEDFDAHQDGIAAPGTCQNRNAADFDGAFDSFWEYPLNPVANIGSSDFLAYPPPNAASGNWQVAMDPADECGTVVYTGRFTWNELVACTSFDTGDGLVTSYVADNDGGGKLTLTGTFYVNVVSPFAAAGDFGFYRVYQLVSQPFVIAVNKNVQVLGAAGVNLFTVSVIAVYKETGASLFKLIVLTEAAEYLRLSRTGLGAGLVAFQSSSVESSQPQISAFSVAETAETENEGCLDNKDYICSQLWQIEAPGDCSEGNDQFIDFSGDYTLQFTPVCRSADELTAAGSADATALHDYCVGWLAGHSSGESSIAAGVGLVATLQWRDEECDVRLFEVQFQAEMLFYTDAVFATEAAADQLYQVGEDRIYVEVDTTWPTSAFDVFDTTLLNVWICTFDPLSPPQMPIEPGSLSGGCFSAAPDGPAIDGAVAGQEFGVDNMYAYHIYDAQSTVTVPDEIAFELVGHPSSPAEMEKLRFSFVVPEQVARDTLYIHAQIEVSLTGGGGRRRQLLRRRGGGRAMANQMSHFLGNIGVSTDERPAPPQVPVNKPAPQPWNQIPSGGENGAYVLSLRSPWIMAIAGLLAVILTCNVAFWCCVRGCGGGRRGRVLFADYEKVKVNESEFDESEANVLNVVSE